MNSIMIMNDQHLIIGTGTGRPAHNGENSSRPSVSSRGSKADGRKSQQDKMASKSTESMRPDMLNSRGSKSASKKKQSLRERFGSLGRASSRESLALDNKDGATLDSEYAPSTSGATMARSYRTNSRSTFRTMATMETTSTQYERLARANSVSDPHLPNVGHDEDLDPSEVDEDSVNDRAPIADSVATGEELSSFPIHKVDLLMKENPSIRSELLLLKEAICEGESRLLAAKASHDADMHKKVWAEMLKIGQLTKDLLDKDKKIVSLYVTIKEQEDSMSTQNESLKSLRTRIHDLKAKKNISDRKANLARRDHNSAIVKLEREKHELMEKTAILEQELQMEKVKTHAQEAAKERALRDAAHMHQNYGFYREYFEKQHELHNKFFSNGVGGEQNNPTGLPDGTSAFSNDGDAPLESKGLLEPDDHKISRSSSAAESSQPEVSRDFERDSTLVSGDRD